jgi:Protein of unknown function (DUF2946)
MQAFRNAHHLARFVLVWFALSIGAAVASPLIKPQDILLICTGSGAMKVLVKADDGSTQEAVSHAMDCPLCLSAGAPPPVIRLTVAPAQPLAYALKGIPAAHIAWVTAAPLPARGPPVFF